MVFERTGQDHQPKKSRETKSFAHHFYCVDLPSDGDGGEIWKKALTTQLANLCGWDSRNQVINLSLFTHK